MHTFGLLYSLDCLCSHNVNRVTVPKLITSESDYFVFKLKKNLKNIAYVFICL